MNELRFQHLIGAIFATWQGSDGNLVALQLDSQHCITMNSFKRILALITSSGILSATFSSCNTTRGVGQDVQHLGHKIEQKADQHS